MNRYNRYGAWTIQRALNPWFWQNERDVGVLIYDEELRVEDTEDGRQLHGFQ
jgi:hypothetical protein